MAFKMRGFNGPFKQTDDKTYPEGYTKEDIKFLKEQREDVVRYEDLDEKGKAIWRKQGKPVPKSPMKQKVLYGSSIPKAGMWDADLYDHKEANFWKVYKNEDGYRPKRSNEQISRAIGTPRGIKHVELDHWTGPEVVMRKNSDLKPRQKLRKNRSNPFNKK